MPGYQKPKEEHREVFVSHSQVSRQFKFVVRSIFLAQLQGHWAPWLQISSESQIIVCICILIQTESFSHLKSLKWPLSGSDEHENIAAAKPQLKQAVIGICRAASEKAFSTNTIIINQPKQNCCWNEKQRSGFCSLVLYSTWWILPLKGKQQQ